LRKWEIVLIQRKKKENPPNSPLYSFSKGGNSKQIKTVRHFRKGGDFSFLDILFLRFCLIKAISRKKCTISSKLKFGRQHSNWSPNLSLEIVLLVYSFKEIA
jgi:hypothetical protein